MMKQITSATRTALILISALALHLAESAAAANSGPALLPFQGRATDSSGVPVISNSEFKIRVYPPAGNCYIYEETQNLTPNSNGFFSTVLGMQANSSGPGNPFVKVFDNNSPVVDSCATQYVPADGDWRRVEVVVNGETMPQMQTVGASAFAVNANAIQGKSASDFIQVSTNVTQANLELLAGGGDVSSLHNHDAEYAKLSGGQFSGNLGTSGSVYASGASSVIGIGTDSPSADLEIEKLSPTMRLAAQSGGGGTMRMDFFSGVNERASIQVAEGTSRLSLFTDATEAVRVDEAQNMSVFGSFRSNGTLAMGRYDATQEATLISQLSSLGNSAAGTLWWNITTGFLRYWNGVAAMSLGNPAGTVTWADLDKTGSSLADLSTRSAGDLSSGTLGDARLSSNVPLKNSTNTFSGAQVVVVPTATQKALVLRSSDSGLSQNVLEVQNSASTPIVTVRADGVPTAPTDIVTKSYLSANLGITALVGDVLASGTGSVTATIANDAVTAAKIKSSGGGVNRLLITDATTGSTVGYATCAVGQMLKWTASGWACGTIGFSEVSDSLADAQLSGNVALRSSANTFTAGQTVAVATAAAHVLTLQSTDGSATNNVLEIRDSGGVARATVRADGVPTTGTDLATKTYVDFKTSGTLGITKVVKAANEAVANSSTLQNDDHFFFTATANTSYLIDMVIRVGSASSNPDIKFTFILPSGAMELGAGSFASDGSTWISGASGVSAFVPIVNSSTQALFIRGMINVGASGGVVRFQWTQNSSNNNAVTVYAGSLMTLTPL